MVIGLSGLARSGKDSFFLLLKSILEGEYECSRTAFADVLKDDLSSLVLDKFNIDLYDCSDEDKELARPLMVSYGTLARAIDEDHWIKKVSKKLDEEQLEDNLISVITDVRYPNEQLFIKNNYKESINVFIQRDGNEPPNFDEAQNGPILKGNSDYIVFWEDFEDQQIQSGEKHVENFIHAKIR
jgi:hypothetical protein